MTRPHRRLLAAAFLAITVTLTGCSGGGDSSGSEDQTSAQDGSDDGSSAEPVENNASTPSDKALVGKKFTEQATYEDQKLTLRFDIVELKRRNDLLHLVVHLTNTATDSSKDLRWQVGGNTFAPQNSREDLSGASDFAGVVLVDVANKKRYLVAADSGGDCVCTGGLSGLFIGAEQTAELTATYAAPPESVKKLDVHVPDLGVFRDVPIS